jgi:MFS family permease
MNDQYTTEAQVSPDPAAGAGQNLMLGVLLLGQFMGLLDTFIVNVAMPQIGFQLHASGATLQLVVGGYTVCYAMLLITGARLGDLFGRRRMFLVGAVGFTLFSLLCGLAPDAVALVLFRCAQGASAAVMVPQIISVIQMSFKGAARARALSAFGVVLSIGAVAGLILGGVIVNADLFGETWRPVFFVNVPLGLALILLTPRAVPADMPRASRRLDAPGLAVAVPAVFLIVLPLVLGRQEGWPLWTFVCLAAGLVLAGLFVPLESRVAARGGDPLLDPSVLRAVGVRSGLSTLSCMQIGYGGFLFVFTLHLQSGLGDSALRAGLTYIPMSGTFGLVGYTWRRIPARLHYMLAPAGLALCGAGYLGVAEAMHRGGYGSALMWAALVVLGVGMGLSTSPLLTQTLVNVPMRLVADASGVLTTTVQLGQVFGIAAAGALYLSLDQGNAAHGQARALASGSAISTTALWLVALSLLGTMTGIALARTVERSSRPAAMPSGNAVPPAPQSKSVS